MSSLNYERVTDPGVSTLHHRYYCFWVKKCWWSYFLSLQREAIFKWQRSPCSGWRSEIPWARSDTGIW